MRSIVFFFGLWIPPGNSLIFRSADHRDILLTLLRFLYGNRIIIASATIHAPIYHSAVEVRWFIRSCDRRRHPRGRIHPSAGSHR